MWDNMQEEKWFPRIVDIGSLAEVDEEAGTGNDPRLLKKVDNWEVAASPTRPSPTSPPFLPHSARCSRLGLPTSAHVSRMPGHAWVPAWRACQATRCQRGPAAEPPVSRCCESTLEPKGNVCGTLDCVFV